MLQEQGQKTIIQLILLYKKQEFERAGFEKIVTINLTGIMHLCTAFYPHLEKSKGNIVNLDSVVSIRVNSIAPGLVPTKLTANQTENPEYAQAVLKQLPISRLGAPEDMAGAALFLASPLASYVTGNQLIVDGGMTL